MVVRNSYRALITGLLPLFVLHFFMLSAVTLGRFGSGVSGDLASADQVLRMLVARVILDAGLMTAFHRTARAFGMNGRGLYSALGAAAAGISYATAISMGFWLKTPVSGAVLAAGLLPVAFGGLAGFIYQHAAGLEQPPHEAISQPEAADAPSESFDGPLQVRTSLAAFAICSALPAFFLFLAVLLWAFPSISGYQFFQSRPNSNGVFLGAALSLQMFVVAALVSCIPTAVFVGINHALMRAMKRTEALAYAAVGAVVAGGLVLIFSTGMLKVGALPAAVCGAIMMAVYRRLAGLEPKSLPEPVLVHDPANLVSADSAARRGHAVVRVR